MPVNWPFADRVIQLGGAGSQHIAPEDGKRQEATARAILQDLCRQPGVILADEVGMGKTYVALGVVASVLLATRGEGHPVVVMMPVGLASKWRMEWEQFKALCCNNRKDLDWVRDEDAHTPADFFRLLDPSNRRRHLIWVTTSCFSRGLSDPWIKLALVRLARKRTKMDRETKRRLYKWATSLVKLRRYRQLDEEMIEQLMTEPPDQWRSILINNDILAKDDPDPIPRHLLKYEHKIEDWSSLVAVLQGEAIPWRRSSSSDRRILEARSDFNEACRHVYLQWLACAEWHASLLVLDEAHHAKNDDTYLARFLRPDTEELLEGDEVTEKPLLWEKFDRMLFLTATPFQLGHQELIRVLHSFAAARWKGKAAPDGSRDDFLAALKELEDRLDENRNCGRRLDKLWGELTRDQFSPYGAEQELTQKVFEWWERLQRGTDKLSERGIMSAVEDCIQTKTKAERNLEWPWAGLSRWVIRHNRTPHLPGKPEVLRREIRVGAAILNEVQAGSTGDGLPIAADAALPFLLAARAQGELAAGSTRARAYFAEGLCSSYEAFHHTRDGRGDVRDVNDEGAETLTDTRPAQAADTSSLVPVSWYEEQIERLIPSREASEEERFRHPKLQAVVDRVVRLWKDGEKVLVFCFYRQTARALRTHVRRQIDKAIIAMVAGKLSLDPSRDEAKVRDRLERITRRLADHDSPFHQGIHEVLQAPFERQEFANLRDHRDELLRHIAAYVRTPAFVARYLPLEVLEVREALAQREKRPDVIRRGVESLCRQLQQQTDGSNLTMLQRIEEFLHFAADLKEREKPRLDTEEEDDSADLLSRYLHAVGVYVEPRVAEEDDETEGKEETVRALQVVRMVNGETRRETRERLMLAFNSPLMPEILISSSVLGEGVDLHRFCRHVIHHDLCWNPSTLEQRTGRLDRIRCKAEIARHPIIVYEPFLAGSADEKMFRVVRDRERWFQVVMGQKFEFDEADSEELLRRVPLPPELARQLIFDLRRDGTP